ncbi:HNH endonuclease [Pantoea sp. 18069]|uniref:HNH endonuclease n=1 Tax=Pantoea sp. 18069 TaxID=2681415 RepID=UPI001359902A|nr:HNH endonuclease [Pantoea sp. 18069]
MGKDIPYNPKLKRAELELEYPGKVISTAVPPTTAANQHLAGKKHPVTEVVLDGRGFPIFDDVAVFDTKISSNEFNSLSYDDQMKFASVDLWNSIKKGEAPEHKFTKNQIEQIKREAKKIDGYTWHHHQDYGRMQLVPALIHNKTDILVEM